MDNILGILFAFSYSLSLLIFVFRCLILKDSLTLYISNFLSIYLPQHTLSHLSLSIYLSLSRLLSLLLEHLSHFSLCTLSASVVVCVCVCVCVHACERVTISKDRFLPLWLSVPPSSTCPDSHLLSFSLTFITTHTHTHTHIYIYIYIYNPHHYVALLARIFLTFSRSLTIHPYHPAFLAVIPG